MKSAALTLIALRCVATVVSVSIGHNVLPLCRGYQPDNFTNDDTHSDTATFIVVSKEKFSTLPLLVFPRLDLESLDPSEVGPLTVEDGAGYFYLRIASNNTMLRGLSDMEVVWSDVDYKEKAFQVQSYLSTFFIYGKYVSKADFYGVVFNGKGTYWVDIVDMFADFSASLCVAKTDNQYRLRLTDTLATFNSSFVNFRFNNFVNPYNDVLDNFANDCLRRHAKHTLQVARAKFLPAFVSFIERTFGEAMRSIPLEEVGVIMTNELPEKQLLRSTVLDVQN